MTKMDRSVKLFDAVQNRKGLFVALSIQTSTKKLEQMELLPTLSWSSFTPKKAQNSTVNLLGFKKPFTELNSSSYKLH